MEFTQKLQQDEIKAYTRARFGKKARKTVTITVKNYSRNEAHA